MKFKKVSKSNLVFNDQKEITMNEDRSFEGVAYSGGIIKDHPFWGNLAFDISTMSAKKSIPVLKNHDMDKIIGSGKLEFNDAVRIKGKISAVTEYGIEAFNLIKEEDFPMQESVYIEPASIVTLRNGEKMEVNGHEIVGPGTVFKGGVIKEVSLTPLGADSETSTTIFNLKEEINIPMEEKMNEDMKKFTDLFSDSPEEAFKFACQCQEKASEASEDDKQKLIDELNAKVDELTKANEALVANAKEKASLERSEKIKKVFSVLGITYTDDLKEVYDNMTEESFNKVFSGLQSDAQKLSEDKSKREKELTSFQEVKGTDTDTDEEKSKKVFSLARELREKSPTTLSVAASLQEARKQLGIEE